MPGLLDVVNQIGRGLGNIYEEQMPSRQQVLGLLGAAPTESVPYPKRKPDFYQTELTQFSDDPVIRAIIVQESGGNPAAVSAVGAQGLMQIMPKTAKKPGFGIKPLKDAFDPSENVRFGTEYFYALKDRLGNTRDALIAYNWGLGNTEKWLKSGGDVTKLPKETRKYYSSILGRLK